MYIEGRYLARRSTNARDRDALRHAMTYLTSSSSAENYPLFDDAGNVVGREDACALLYERRGAVALAHRHIISPNPDGGVSAAGLPALIRDAYLRWAWERGWGTLVFVAAIHTNTSVPHGHLWLAGHTRRGRELDLRPDDYAALRAIALDAEERMARKARVRRRTLRAL